MLPTCHQFASRKIRYQKQILDMEMCIYLFGLLGHYLPTATQYYFKCGDKSGFALRAAEDRKLEQYRQQCANIGGQVIPMAFESFGGLSEMVRKTLKRIALLTDNRTLYSAGSSFAFSRLAQSILVTHTNARKRYYVHSRKRRTVSQLQAKEASLMSHDL